MPGVRTARRFGYSWKNLEYRTGLYFFGKISPSLLQEAYTGGKYGAPLSGSVKSIHSRSHRVLSPNPGKKKNIFQTFDQNYGTIESLGPDI